MGIDKFRDTNKKEFYEFILDSIDAGIYINTPNDWTIWSNNFICTKGFTPNEIQDLNRKGLHNEYYHPDDVWVFEDSYKYLLDTDIAHATTIYRQKDRNMDWASLFVKGKVAVYTIDKDIAEAVMALIQVDDKYLEVNRMYKLLKENLYLKNKNKLAVLSKREKEILKLISKGLSSKEIAETLIVSFHTIETHRKNILKKLNFKNVAELVSFAAECGL